MSIIEVVVVVVVAVVRVIPGIKTVKKKYAIHRGMRGLPPTELVNQSVFIPAVNQCP
jgi:hypothetical protein